MLRCAGDDFVLPEESDRLLHSLFVRDDHPFFSGKVWLASCSDSLDLAVFARVAEVGTDTKCIVLIDKSVDLFLGYLFGILMRNPVGQMVAVYEKRCNVVFVVFWVLVDVRRARVNATHALEIAFSAVELEHGSPVRLNVLAKGLARFWASPA